MHIQVSFVLWCGVLIHKHIYGVKKLTGDDILKSFHCCVWVNCVLDFTIIRYHVYFSCAWKSSRLVIWPVLGIVDRLGSTYFSKMTYFATLLKLFTLSFTFTILVLVATRWTQLTWALTLTFAFLPECMYCSCWGLRASESSWVSPRCRYFSWVLSIWQHTYVVPAPLVTDPVVDQWHQFLLYVAI